MRNFFKFVTFFCASHLAASSSDRCNWMLETYIAKFDEVGLASRLDVPRVNEYLLNLKEQKGVTVTEVAKPFGMPVYKVRVKSSASSGLLPMNGGITMMSATCNPLVNDQYGDRSCIGAGKAGC